MKTLNSILTFIYILIGCLILPIPSSAQTDERLDRIEQHLNTIASSSPGINEIINLSVSGVSIQEFLRALAEAADLNINVDQNLDRTIFNNFQAETALNILLFLAKEYDLDYSFIGNIISVKPFDSSKQPHKASIIKASFNTNANTITLDLKNDSLSVVSKTITKLTGTNVIVTSDLKGQLIELFVKDMHLDDALKQLAFNNKIKLKETSDGAFVFMPLALNEENYIGSNDLIGIRRVSKVADGQAGTPSGLQIEANVDKTGLQQLISVDAQNIPIEQIIKTAAEQINANYFLYDGIIGTVTTHLQNVSFEDLLIALLKGTNYTHKNINDIYTIGSRNLEGLREIKVIQLQHRAIDTIQSMIPSEWKKGIEIKEFREQNTLLITGSGPQVNEIGNLIKELDKLVPMILIEVNMLDIRKGHEVKTGIQAGISDSIQTGGSILPGIDYTFGAASINNFLSKVGAGGTFNLGRVTPNFYVRLSALEQNNNVEMRSVPKLSTLNGHTASLSIGNSRYYSVSTQNVLGSLNPQTVVTETFNKVDAAMIIDIKPIVSGDEQVTLNIKIDISDFTKDTPLNQPPPSTTSKFESIIRIRNEETVVLGGIERFESSSSGSGVPLLARIPGLKWLFSSRSKSRNKVVSVVFIKPTIIYQ
ncbi:hypothetical protein [Albibacterium sp.]|uniref:type II secretion system protein GspD n=1 Tax=Albibacterium sp. TaxID=2952885 RepID=UPI002BC2FDF1|nr:hypothetical protein [Albibacterium sp.]HUH17857.1 hypothetical protein [Albibacterium sp.]